PHLTHARYRCHPDCRCCSRIFDAPRMAAILRSPSRCVWLLPLPVERPHQIGDLGDSIAGCFSANAARRRRFGKLTASPLCAFTALRENSLHGCDGPQIERKLSVVALLLFSTAITSPPASDVVRRAQARFALAPFARTLPRVD